MDAGDDPEGDDGSLDPWADDGDDWADEAGPSAGAPEGDADATAGDDWESTGGGGASVSAGEGAALGPRRYRVLDRDADAEALVLVDLDTPDPGPGPAPDEGFEPVRVAATGYDGALAETVDSLDPGYVVRARLRWPGHGAGGGDPDATPLARFDSASIERESRYLFADAVENLFEAARDAWQDARAAGEGMASRVTRDTDGEPNGALYVFAEAGARDLLGEFRSGTTPLEPLVERVNEDLGDDEPREVFVLRPERGAFVVVYIAFERDGLLARTVRDTYF
ncbi:DUF6663 family protein [Halobaculum sp. EA56]|uniref:DUF6663 family protein n=1 Tax=Halobaculum sp. EA56 TaxID=3421648 RepID=UPI003EBD8992